MDKCLLVVLLVVAAVVSTVSGHGGGMMMSHSSGPLIIPYPLKIPFLGGEGHYEYSDKKSGYGGGGNVGYHVGHGGPLIIPQPITWVDQHQEYY